MWLTFAHIRTPNRRACTYRPLPRTLRPLPLAQVGVRFQVARALPLAHNKMAALTRTGWRRMAVGWLERTADGRAVMARAAEIILEQEENSGVGV